jgi:hypothetical protein
LTLTPLRRGKGSKDGLLDLFQNGVEPGQRVGAFRSDRDDVATFVVGVDLPLHEATRLELGEGGGDVAPVDTRVTAEVGLARRPPLLECGQQAVVIAPQSVALGLEAGGQQR